MSQDFLPPPTSTPPAKLENSEYLEPDGTKCAQTDAKCLCTDTVFQAATYQCLMTTCTSPADIQAGAAFGTTNCLAVGVTLATAPAAASSTVAAIVSSASASAVSTSSAKASAVSSAAASASKAASSVASVIASSAPAATSRAASASKAQVGSGLVGAALLAVLAL
ncbi:hypothetical protein P7C70_g7793, partial [Phenoliferia sp. Uapishka_3]